MHLKYMSTAGRLCAIGDRKKEKKQGKRREKKNGEKEKQVWSTN